MIRVKLPSGEERTINTSASDIAFVQKLIALNDKITHEINLQANGLLSEEGAQGNAASFSRLKALVDKLHTLLCDTVFVEEAQSQVKPPELPPGQPPKPAAKKAVKKAKKAAAKKAKKGGAK